MGTRVTLKDVAAAVGVSPATVSLVLNGKPVRISDERRAQIQKVASSMRYRPNQAARALVTRRSNMVGLVVPDIENMFFSSLFKALEDVAIRDGYSVIVANSDDSRERERSLICGVSARGVDGLFLVPALQSCAQEAALRRDVEECPCPVVFVDRLVDSGYCDGVGVDNEEGGRLAAEVLIDSLAAGARDARKGRVGCVCVERVDGISDLRFRGFADALAKAGVPLDAECIVKGDYRYSSGYEAADRLLDAGVGAAFCVNSGFVVLTMWACVFYAGCGMMYSPVVSTVLGTIEKDESGRGVGMNDLAMNVSPSIGIAIIGSLLGSNALAGHSITGTTGVAANYSNLLLIGSVTALLGLIVFFVFKKKIYEGNHALENDKANA